MARFDMQPRWPEVMRTLPGFTGALSKEAEDFIEMMNRRDLVLEDWLGDNTEGGSRWGTVVVAADDSSDAGKAGADFVCTGTDDHETLVEAALALPRLFGLLPIGAITLLEGGYNVAGSISGVADGLFFSLIEWRATGFTKLMIPTGNNGTFTLLEDCGTWKGFQIDGNGTGQSSGAVILSTGCFFTDCSLVAGKDGAMVTPGLFPTTRCVNTSLDGAQGGLTTSPVATSPGVYDECTIRHNQGGIHVTGAISGTTLTVLGGSITRLSQTPVDFTNTQHVLLDSGAAYSELRVQGVVFPGNTPPSQTIVHVGAGPSWIRDNDILGSTDTAALPDCHQVVIDGGDRGMIEGNTITGAGSGGVAVCDAIHLQGGAHNNTIQGNRTGYQVSSGERSGIYLDATTFDNTAIDVLNDLTNYNVAAVIDLGTNNLTSLGFPTPTDVATAIDAAIALVNEAAPAVTPAAAAAGADSTLLYMINEAGSA